MKWHPYGGTDISGEWHRTGGYYSEIKRGRKYNHNYMCSIKENSAFKFGEKGWRLFISMGTNCMHMGDLIDIKFETLKEAKDYAKKFIEEYDVSIDALDKVEHYKLEECKPVFDMDLNYIGNDYAGTICYNNKFRKYYDYYNDKPIDYEGKHYVLNIVRDKLVLGLMKCYPCVQGYESINDKNLSLQLLNTVCKIPYKYFEKYRKWRNENVEKRTYSKN